MSTSTLRKKAAMGFSPFSVCKYARVLVANTSFGTRRLAKQQGERNHLAQSERRCVPAIRSKHSHKLYVRYHG